MGGRAHGGDVCDPEVCTWPHGQCSNMTGVVLCVCADGYDHPIFGVLDLAECDMPQRLPLVLGAASIVFCFLLAAGCLARLHRRQCRRLYGIELLSALVLAVLNGLFWKRITPRGELDIVAVATRALGAVVMVVVLALVNLDLANFIAVFDVHEFGPRARALRRLFSYGAAFFAICMTVVGVSHTVLLHRRTPGAVSGSYGQGDFTLSVAVNVLDDTAHLIVYGVLMVVHTTLCTSLIVVMKRIVAEYPSETFARVACRQFRLARMLVLTASLAIASGLAVSLAFGTSNQMWRHRWALEVALMAVQTSCPLFVFAAQWVRHKVRIGSARLFKHIQIPSMERTRIERVPRGNWHRKVQVGPDPNRKGSGVNVSAASSAGLLPLGPMPQRAASTFRSASSSSSGMDLPLIDEGSGPWPSLGISDGLSQGSFRSRRPTLAAAGPDGGPGQGSFQFRNTAISSSSQSARRLSTVSRNGSIVTGPSRGGNGSRGSRGSRSGSFVTFADEAPARRSFRMPADAVTHAGPIAAAAPMPKSDPLPVRRSATFVGAPSARTRSFGARGPGRRSSQNDALRHVALLQI